jgi:hypothetical protein
MRYMTFQGTNAFVPAYVPRSSKPISINVVTDTTDGTFEPFEVPVIHHDIRTPSDLLRTAWSVAAALENSDVSRRANVLIYDLLHTLQALHPYWTSFPDLPSFHPFVEDDGALLIEWVFEDFRIGFNTEVDPKESSWYLVSNAKLDEISASAYSPSVEHNPRIPWLLIFALLNS